MEENSNYKVNFERSKKTLVKASALSEEFSVIFIALQENLLIKKLDDTELLDILLEMKCEDHVKNIASLQRKLVQFICFDSDIAAKKFKREFLNYNGMRILYSSQCEELNTIEVKISDLTVKAIRENIPPILEKFGEIIELAFEKTEIKENCFIERPPAKIKLKLGEKIKIENIPYKIQLNSNNYAWLKIKNREPICYKCSELGHVIKNCTKIWCGKCKTLHFDRCNNFKLPISRKGEIKETLRESSDKTVIGETGMIGNEKTSKQLSRLDNNLSPEKTIAKKLKT